jgi:lysozyme family protein
VATAVSFTPELVDEYARLFDALNIDPQRRNIITSIYRRIVRPDSLSQYTAIGRQAGVPWFVIAIIHNLESNGDFSTHLHNGDPLTGRTVRVPAGRPVAPPTGPGGTYTWVESAIDALQGKVAGGTDWTIPGIAYVLERYNGFGYRLRYPHVKSPYLWSYSNIYTRGKFISDGRFSDDAVSQQCGGMVLLRHMLDVNTDVESRLVVSSPPPLPDDAQPTPHPRQDGSERDYPSPPHRFPGGFIIRGMGGTVVQDIQQRLAQVGAMPNLNGIFDEVTELAVELFQARSTDETGEPLEIDGVVGPLTWGALFGPGSGGERFPPAPHGPSSNTFLDTVLEIAGSQVGVMENPPGSNRGTEVEGFLRSVNVPPGNPWSMAFVYWCFREATSRFPGDINRVPQTGLVLDAWQRSQHLPEITVVCAARAQSNPSLVTPGMVFFLDMGRGRGHAGIVTDLVGGRLMTIEGNSNRGGSREGVGVFSRKRGLRTNSLLGFASYG